MPYEFYKVLHLVGIFMIIVSLGGLCLHVMNGGTREHHSRKLVAILHGIGMFVALVGGFGLLARLGLAREWPLWATAKLIIWLILGGLPAFIYRKPQLAKLFWASIIAFAGLAAYFAIYKPVLG